MSRATEALLSPSCTLRMASSFPCALIVRSERLAFFVAIVPVEAIVPTCVQRGRRPMGAAQTRNSKKLGDGKNSADESCGNF